MSNKFEEIKMFMFKYKFDSPDLNFSRKITFSKKYAMINIDLFELTDILLAVTKASLSDREKVVRIDFSHNWLWNDDLNIIGQIVDALPNLKEVDLSETQIRGPFNASLFLLLEHPNIEFVDVSNTHLGSTFSRIYYKKLEENESNLKYFKKLIFFESMEEYNREITRYFGSSVFQSVAHTTHEKFYSLKQKKAVQKKIFV